MTAKHTPGPWVHDKRGYPHPDVKSACGRNIACTWGVNNQPKTKEAYESQKQVARANARLIAAAPELLDACKKALYALKGREHDQFLRDAISKATGGEA